VPEPYARQLLNAASCSVAWPTIATSRRFTASAQPSTTTIASFHAYPPDATVRRVRGAVNEVRAVLRREGAGNRRVWVTDADLRRPRRRHRARSALHRRGRPGSIRQALYGTVGADAIFFYQLSDTGIYNSAGEGIKQVIGSLR